MQRLCIERLNLRARGNIRELLGGMNGLWILSVGIPTKAFMELKGLARKGLGDFQFGVHGAEEKSML